MPIFNKGNFTLDLGLLKISAEVSDQDRQSAWELYTEITTRVSLVGKCNDTSCEDFSGEVLEESLNSVHAFFREARMIMRKFPVGQLDPSKAKEGHLGVLINDLLNSVLRPFLEKWQSDYRHWWRYQANEKTIPFERQQNYPRYDEFINEWKDVRMIMRELRKELIRVYELVDVDCLAAARRKAEDGQPKDSH